MLTRRQLDKVNSKIFSKVKHFSKSIALPSDRFNKRDDSVLREWEKLKYPLAANRILKDYLN